MRSRSLLGALVLALTLATSSAAAKPPATAKIVEHVSAGGVEIGMARSAMLRAWGPANECVKIETSWSAEVGVEHCSWGARGQQPSQLEVQLFHAKVISIHVRLIPFVEGGFPGWKTTKGIALGATPGAVRQAYGAQLRQAAADSDYGGHLYLSKQVGETVVETRFSFPQDYEREQVVRQIAIYDLAVRNMCGTVTGPPWTKRAGSFPSERGTRYLVRVTSGSPKRQVKCAFARTWAARLVRQRPRKLYPKSASSNSLAGPTKPKRYLCAGETGGRGPNANFTYVKTGPWAIVGQCSPFAGQGFGWAPDTSRDHVYDDD